MRAEPSQETLGRVEYQTLHTLHRIEAVVEHIRFGVFYFIGLSVGALVIAWVSWLVL